MRPFLHILIYGLALGLSAEQVHAHAIQSSLEHLGSFGDTKHQNSTKLQLAASFSTGQPVKNAAVRLVSLNGEAPVEIGETNASGSLTFTLPETNSQDWELQVDGGPGHRDYLQLPQDGLQTITSMNNASSAFQPLAIGPLAFVGLLGGLVSLQQRRRHT